MNEPLELLPEQLCRITSHLRHLGWIGPGAQLCDPQVAGPGNMNRTLRVQCSQGPTSLVLKQSVPYVAKYPSIPAPIERCASEAAFYKAVAGTPLVRDCMPQLLGFDAQNHLLAFEDLGPAADMSFIYRGIYRDRGVNSKAEATTVEVADTELQPLVAWLSALHALSDLPNLTNTAMRELNHTHIFELPLQANNGLDLGELNSIAATLAANTDLVKAASRLGEIYLGRRTHRSTPVLLHGDFYPGSWLHVNTDTRVIDPEFGFVGPAEFDVGVFVAHLMFAGLNQQRALGALANYQQPPGFDAPLMLGFAGIELIRRLLGVAQLPLVAAPPERIRLLNRAVPLVTASLA